MMSAESRVILETIVALFERLYNDADRVAVIKALHRLGCPDCGDARGVSCPCRNDE